MNPVLWVIDAHIVALGLLSFFCLMMEGRDSGEEKDNGGEPAGFG